MYKIGKAADNDIVIHNPYISRYHARLKVDGNNGIIIEDLDSTNGTYVNGKRIRTTIISPEDKILLGKDYVLDIPAAFKTINDYSLPFSALKEVYDRYSEAKVKIQSRNMFKTRLIQTLPFALIGMSGLLISFIKSDYQGFFGISLLVFLLAPVTGIYMAARQSAKVPRQLSELANQFKIDYVCPKCGTFLGEIPWESLKNKKSCTVPNCKARWINENE